MWLILVVLLCLITLVVYNFMNISRSKFCPIELKNLLLDHMVNCRVRSAIEVAANDPSYLGRMMAYALPNVDANRPEDLGREGVEVAVADFTANETRVNMVWVLHFPCCTSSAHGWSIWNSTWYG